MKELPFPPNKRIVSRQKRQSSLGLSGSPVQLQGVNARGTGSPHHADITLFSLPLGDIRQRKLNNLPLGTSDRTSNTCHCSVAVEIPATLYIRFHISQSLRAISNSNCCCRPSSPCLPNIPGSLPKRFNNAETSGMHHRSLVRNRSNLCRRPGQDRSMAYRALWSSGTRARKDGSDVSGCRRFDQRR